MLKESDLNRKMTSMITRFVTILKTNAPLRRLYVFMILLFIAIRWTVPKHINLS